MPFQLLEVVVEVFTGLVVFVVGVVKRFAGLLADYLELEVLNGGAVDEVLQ